ncbi:hypothetical protein SCHPADRAFT_946331 [Schizopora paradoxa]|uniref:Uncharacterized protein n=1 Tax=Schizopora paradoxa TaxID=27342 RepID=A0A0H2R317_9AGAM|nr:hypothetical protein SCHPADRAFT_946331 [Schizopora paradoxa]
MSSEIPREVGDVLKSISNAQIDSRYREMMGEMREYLDKRLLEEVNHQRSATTIQMEQSLRDSRLNIEMNTEQTFTQVFSTLGEQRAMWDSFIASSRDMMSTVEGVPKKFDDVLATLEKKFESTLREVKILKDNQEYTKKEIGVVKSEMANLKGLELQVSSIGSDIKLQRTTIDARLSTLQGSTTENFHQIRDTTDHAIHDILNAISNASLTFEREPSSGAMDELQIDAISSRIMASLEEKLLRVNERFEVFTNAFPALEECVKTLKTTSEELKEKVDVISAVALPNIESKISSLSDHHDIASSRAESSLQTMGRIEESLGRLECPASSNLDATLATVSERIQLLTNELPKLGGRSQEASEEVKEKLEAISGVTLPSIESKISSLFDSHSTTSSQMLSRIDSMVDELDTQTKLTLSAERVEESIRKLERPITLDDEVKKKLDAISTVALPSIESKVSSLLDRHDGASKQIENTMGRVEESLGRLVRPERPITLDDKVKEKLDAISAIALPSIESKISSLLDRHEPMAGTQIKDTMGRVEEPLGKLGSPPVMSSLETTIITVGEQVQHVTEELPKLEERIREASKDVKERLDAMYVALPSIESKISRELSQISSMAVKLEAEFMSLGEQIQARTNVLVAPGLLEEGLPATLLSIEEKLSCLLSSKAALEPKFSQLLSKLDAISRMQEELALNTKPPKGTLSEDERTTIATEGVSYSTDAAVMGYTKLDFLSEELTFVRSLLSQLTEDVVSLRKPEGQLRSSSSVGNRISGQDDPVVDVNTLLRDVLLKIKELYDSKIEGTAAAAQSNRSHICPQISTPELQIMRCDASSLETSSSKVVRSSTGLSSWFARVATASYYPLAKALSPTSSMLFVSKRYLVTTGDQLRYHERKNRMLILSCVVIIIGILLETFRRSAYTPRASFTRPREDIPEGTIVGNYGLEYLVEWLGRWWP